MSIRDVLKGIEATPAVGPSQGKAWDGPESPADNGGITFSMLSRYLTCRERFRIMVVDGLRPAEGFNHRIEYGNMWHLCEEHKDNGHSVRNKSDGKSQFVWEVKLLEYTKQLAAKHRLQQEQVLHWYEVCRRQFPVYVDYWSKHKDMRNRTPLLAEEKFKVPYKLPSGRTVFLRGKWDSVDLIMEKGRKKVASPHVWLQENKSKGEIDETAIPRQLTFDLQTMIYLVALKEYQLNSFWQRANKLWRNVPVAGVRYNVIRRPLSGGKGSIRQHQPTKANPQGESKESFYNRLEEYFKEDPGFFFMRWDVTVTQSDIDRFKQRCLNPLLEQLCIWWDWVSQKGNPFANESPETDPQYLHYQHPFGVRNVLDEGGHTDVDDYLLTGSTTGLENVETLFPELA